MDGVTINLVAVEDKDGYLSTTLGKQRVVVKNFQFHDHEQISITRSLRDIHQEACALTRRSPLDAPRSTIGNPAIPPPGNPTTRLSGNRRSGHVSWNVRHQRLVQRSPTAGLRRLTCWRLESATQAKWKLTCSPLIAFVP
uniref:HDC00897 n=1 Tax=Drosophila melanogaster TaxID=7227 RepID=Q6IHU7_DROME|nr:TPA_inf: HDC00897 [Drosophila melanogaster]